MEDAYNLLLDNKQSNESFSEEIRRMLSKKKTRNLSEFFGAISDKEGESMLSDLKKIKYANIKLIKKMPI